MIKKGLLVMLLFFIYGCSGAMRLAEEGTNDTSTPSKDMVVKPNK